MSFSYTLDSPDATVAAVARVRLEIGDTVAGAGVLPDGGNLSDEEIGVYLARTGNDVALTVSALAGVLARRWATQADVTVGPRSEKLSQVAQAWERQGGAPTGTAGAGGAGGVWLQPVRVDGFSERAGEAIAEY